MLLPNTGEWIAGGWDPGVYLNTGINVGQTGTFTPQDKAFGADFTPAERSHFMRYPSNRSERFPGILSNKNGTEINFHFFTSVRQLPRFL